MSGRFKLLKTMIMVVLFAGLIFGPPSAFASKLPSICSPFAKKSIEVHGPCGNPVNLTQEPMPDQYEAFTLAIDSCFNNFSKIRPYFFYPILALLGNSLASTPLRC